MRSQISLVLFWRSLTDLALRVSFGMGIDKPDVRFVIHYTLSQSLEAYYQVRWIALFQHAHALTSCVTLQETGRAGRDGATSTCVLFYSYADTKLIMRLIDEGEGTREQKDHNRANIRRVVQYCINENDCRRSQVLQYFGEKFPREECHKTCDNCMAPKTSEPRDVGELASEAVNLVRAIQMNKGITMLYAIDVFRGSKTQKVRSFRRAFRFLCADWSPRPRRSSRPAMTKSRELAKARASTATTANGCSNSWPPSRFSANDSNAVVPAMSMPMSPSVRKPDSSLPGNSRSRWDSPRARASVPRRRRTPPVLPLRPWLRPRLLLPADSSSTSRTTTPSTAASTSTSFTMRGRASTTRGRWSGEFQAYFPAVRVLGADFVSSRRDDYGGRIVRSNSLTSAASGPEATDALLAQLLDLREQVRLFFSRVPRCLPLADALDLTVHSPLKNTTLMLKP